MRGVFDDDELEQPRLKRDAELTLGIGTLFLIFLGLVLICGFCFGLGYVMGHRGAQQEPASPSGTQAGSQANGSLSKPSATSQTAVPPVAENTSTQSDGSQPGATGSQQPATAVVVPVDSQQNPSPAASNPSQPLVHPALPPQASAPPQTASVSSVHPGVPAAAPMMVQIAAVSHVEDAKVLTDALKKRGYAVVARREPADNLIHVRIGPFNNRDEANRWRLKLLGDGYNAILQP